jgi:hypothetical protein
MVDRRINENERSQSVVVDQHCFEQRNRNGANNVDTRQPFVNRRRWNRLRIIACHDDVLPPTSIVLQNGTMKQ